MNMNTFKEEDGSNISNALTNTILRDFPSGVLTLKEFVIKGRVGSMNTDNYSWYDLSDFVCVIIIGGKACMNNLICEDCHAYTDIPKNQLLNFWFKNHTVEECVTAVENIAKIVGKEELL